MYACNIPMHSEECPDLTPWERTGIPALYRYSSWRLEIRTDETKVAYYYGLRPTGYGVCRLPQCPNGFVLSEIS